MTQLTTSGARVVDPILTTVAQGYKNSEFVGGYLLPRVPVAQRAGKIIQFGREAFQSYDNQRAPGSVTKRIQIGYSDQAFSLTDRSLDAVVPRELLEEAQAVPGINLASSSIRTVQDAMALRLEVEQATLVLNAGNYASTNKITLSGTSQFSDPVNSDPIAAVETAKDAIRQATGKVANTIVMGYSVLKAVRQHSKIIDRIKYTGRDIPTPELLAALWGVDNVYIGSAIQSDDLGNFSDVWGKNMVVAYTNQAGLADNGAPTFGYTYALNGYPFVEVAHFDESTKSWIYGVSDACQAVIASQNSGYLISAAVA
jgi:hypothetical protein